MKIMLDLFLPICYHILVLKSTYPGVAKFGIALEWGSRGLEFESRHSDQKPERHLLFWFFIFAACGNSIRKR